MSEIQQQLHQQPFKLRNNRKLTRARYKMLAMVQSIAVYEQLKDVHGLTYDGRFLGFKHIVHA